MSSRRITFLLLLLIIFTALRLLSASYYNSRTTDESAHLAAGMEWLERQTYYVEELHPPLARALIALPLYLRGVHMRPETLSLPCATPYPVFHEKISGDGKKGYFVSRCWGTGDLKLLYQGDYSANLHLSRLAGIGWLILGAIYLYALTLSLSNRETALLSVFAWTMLPLVLAHAGLANTDLPAATSVIVAVYYSLYWLRERTWQRALLLGAGFALCGLVKFSALVYAGAIFIPLLLWVGKEQRHIPSFFTDVFLHGIIAFLTMFLLIWAGYRFSLGSLSDVFPFAYHAVQQTPDSFLATISAAPILPMPEWFMGWLLASLKNAKGHATYVLGTPLKDVGVWYFFPVALWFKTPLSVWAMVFSALVLGIKNKQRWLLWPALWCLTILAIGMTSNINLGTRHILPLFAFLSMIAAAGCHLLWHHASWGRWLSLGLIFWLALSSILAHPRHIPFFNSTAGDEPQHVLVDSDLAWGQDFGLLVHELKTRDLQNVTVCSTDFARFKNYPLEVRQRVHRDCPSSAPKEGWMVINYNMYFVKGDRIAWLKEHTPVTNIGNSYELYYFGK